MDERSFLTQVPCVDAPINKAAISGSRLATSPNLLMEASWPPEPSITGFRLWGYLRGIGPEVILFRKKKRITLTISLSSGVPVFGV